MPTVQDRQKPDEASIHASRGGKVNKTLRKLFNGFDNGLTTGGRVRLHPRRGRQREHKGGNSCYAVGVWNVGEHPQRVVCDCGKSSDS